MVSPLAGRARMSALPTRAARISAVAVAIGGKRQLGARDPTQCALLLAAAGEGSDLLGAEGCDINGLQNFDRVKFWQTPTEDCLGDCPPLFGGRLRQQLVAPLPGAPPAVVEVHRRAAHSEQLAEAAEHVGIDADLGVDGIDELLTGRENLAYHARLHGVRAGRVTPPSRCGGGVGSPASCNRLALMRFTAVMMCDGINHWSVSR